MKLIRVCPERQLESFRLLKGLIDTSYNFKDKEEARGFFTELTSLYKNWNYSASGSTEFDRYRKEIVDLAVQHGYIGNLGSLKSISNSG